MNSTRMLDILGKFLIRKGYCFSRLDGSTPTILRQSIVDDFNLSPSKQVCRLISFSFSQFEKYTDEQEKKVEFEVSVVLDSDIVFLIGVPYINPSWWAWAESCQCKSGSNI